VAKKSKWVQRWEVPSDSRSDTSYVVAIDAEGNWACSCPVWKFKRIECKHIQYVRDEMGAAPAAPERPRPASRPAQPSPTNGSQDSEPRSKSRTAFIEF